MVNGLNGTTGSCTQTHNGTTGSGGHGYLNGNVNSGGTGNGAAATGSGAKLGSHSMKNDLEKMQNLMDQARAHRTNKSENSNSNDIINNIPTPYVKPGSTTWWPNGALEQ